MSKNPHSLETEKVFTDIVIHRRGPGTWFGHTCGTGSRMENTQNIREQLPAALEHLGCTSMLDAPCGDYSWMSTITWPEDFGYIGADIVEQMINTLKSQWPTVDFRHLDIIHDPLPAADVMFCRDCLVHLPWADIKKVIENVVASDIKYLATTSFLHGDQEEITTGRHRPINLQQAPSNFPEPVYAIEDQDAPELGKHMMFWSKSQLTAALEQWQ